MSTNSDTIIHSEGTFEGFEGVRLFSQSWQSKEVPKRAILVILHGLKDHSSRYSELAALLVPLGYIVHGFDLRGHGRSNGNKVYVNKFEDYLTDYKIFVKRLREQNPNLPIFAFGHSMGGTIVTLSAMSRIIDFKGIILSAPALKPGASISPLLIKMTRFLGVVTPRLPLMDLPNANFSRDPKVVAEMSADPFIYQKNGPVRTAAQFLGAMQLIQKRMEELTFPVLILHGTTDKLTNPEGSKELAKRARSTDKTLKLYEGLVHDLVHEPEKVQVISDITNWLLVH